MGIVYDEEMEKPFDYIVIPQKTLLKEKTNKVITNIFPTMAYLKF